jgi:hypothetical protein
VAKDAVYDPEKPSDVTILPGGYGLFPRGYDVHFIITENFQDAGGPGQEVVVHTGTGGGDCGYPFIVGTSYLVYASRHDGVLGTGTCSGTSPAVMVAGVLRQMRAARDGERVDDLFGTVGMGPRGVGSEDLVETRPLGNIAVNVVDKNGVMISTLTDEHGAYRFPSLPPNTYHIQWDLPAGLRTGNEKQLTLQIAGTSTTGAGCQADAFARPDGQISGMVIDGTGQGVPGFVTLRPIDPKEAEEAMRHGGLPGYDSDDGHFLLAWIPPGRYRLIFYPKIGRAVSFRQAFYWPLFLNASNPASIEVGLGQHIENVRFEVSVTSHTAQ